MKINRKHKDAAEVSTESLNDIMFFLLLFFLIVSSLANSSVLKLSVPDANILHNEKPPQVAVEINASHEYVVNKLRIPFADLENTLKVELARTKSPNILLVLDKTLSVQDLADVMQIGYSLGVKMILETKSNTK
jgi:biopolymer transport protein ExbD